LENWLYKPFLSFGADRLVWKAIPGRLRILCYHGVCEDRFADEAWLPDYFVSESAFVQQLEYLRQCAHVLPLGDAIQRLRDGSLPERAVSLTFDDGYANNLFLAYRLLTQFQMRATVFLSSAYVESGELYPFIKLRLVHMYGGTGCENAPEYKSRPLQEVADWLNERWPEVRGGLTEDQIRTLRPLTVREVQEADLDFIEFGGHTDTHCILRNETAERRKDEICCSIRKVMEWTGRPVRLFSYPNGERGDFAETDKQTLREKGIRAAVTGIAGANGSDADLLELKRFPVGLYHGSSGFRAEVTGFRSVVLGASGGMRS
jgi:peptidoglycan/xylan/chitin deacetylase (PgdA/CDA1 family)